MIGIVGCSTHPSSSQVESIPGKVAILHYASAGEVLALLGEKTMKAIIGAQKLLPLSVSFCAYLVTPGESRMQRVDHMSELK